MFYPVHGGHEEHAHVGVDHVFEEWVVRTEPTRDQEHQVDKNGQRNEPTQDPFHDQFVVLLEQ